MNFPFNLRDRRALFGPTHYSITNYCTDTKNDMKATFSDDIFHSLHLIPDPLKKNLADTMITEEKIFPKTEFRGIDTKSDLNMPSQTDYSPLTGITNFISGVFNVISGAMFSRRKPSEFVADSSKKMAVPSVWQDAKSGDENKIPLVQNYVNDSCGTGSVGEMSDCRAAAAHCQNKLERVRQLLSQPVPCTGRLRRRPRKVFVDPNSVEDCFEDAFAPEDFETLSNDSYVEYVSPACYHSYDYQEIDAPRTKIEFNPVIENTNIVKNVPELETKTEKEETPIVTDQKEELVASCEDKLAKLKALLQGRRNKPQIIIEPEPVDTEIKEVTKPKTANKVKDKRYKNPHRCSDKRRSTKMKQRIEDDLLFANQLFPEEVSSVENSPSTHKLENYISNTEEPNKDYFDEVSGRFHSTSVTDSEDSFQIVFNNPKRVRKTSDCDSEDSFIVFEDSPDSCYTSNDVFGDSSETDYDSDYSDSGCGTLMSKLSHSLTKSVSNLADDSLYVNASEDEVDCAHVENLSLCENLPVAELNTGLLLDSKKKELRKNLPAKTVRFSEAPPRVHTLRVWAFAARQARAGHWERYALDRERFKRRIADVEVAVSWVLKPQHRSRVMFQRFMPWWNALRRREIAEKKMKEEEERIREAELETKLGEEKLRESDKEDVTKLGEEKLRQSDKEVTKLEEEKLGESQKVTKVGDKLEVTNPNLDEQSKSMDVTEMTNQGNMQNNEEIIRNNDKNGNIDDVNEKLQNDTSNRRNSSKLIVVTNDVTKAELVEITIGDKGIKKTDKFLVQGGVLHDETMVTQNVNEPRNNEIYDKVNETITDSGHTDTLNSKLSETCQNNNNFFKEDLKIHTLKNT